MIVWTRYGAAEAAEASGASPVLQRTWRHRGILPAKAEAGRAKFDAADIARLAALRALSDSGLSASKLGSLSFQLSRQTLALLVQIPGACDFVPPPGWLMSDRGVEPYLFVPLPEKSAPEIGQFVPADRIFASDWSRLDGAIGATGSWCGVVFDCHALARHIHAKLQLPIARDVPEVEGAE